MLPCYWAKALACFTVLAGAQRGTWWHPLSEMLTSKSHAPSQTEELLGTSHERFSGPPRLAVSTFFTKSAVLKGEKQYRIWINFGIFTTCIFVNLQTNLLGIRDTLPPMRMLLYPKNSKLIKKNTQYYTYNAKCVAYENRQTLIPINLRQLKHRWKQNPMIFNLFQHKLNPLKSFNSALISFQQDPNFTQ